MVQENPFKEFFAQLAFAITTGGADDPDDILDSYEYRDDTRDDTGSSGESQPECYSEQALKNLVSVILDAGREPLTALNAVWSIGL